jgi:hypothetical protein
MRRLWQTNPELHPNYHFYQKPVNNEQQQSQTTTGNTVSPQNNTQTGFSIVNPGFLNSGIFGGIGGSSGSYGGSYGGGSSGGGSLPDNFDDSYIENIGGGSGTGGGSNWWDIGGSSDVIGFGYDFDSGSRTKSSGNPQIKANSASGVYSKTKKLFR